ncbi:MAG TPA: thioredoxin [Tenericutes bacterium]|nr:thioredoxin [Mycoplasmatota bacterium]
MKIIDATQENFNELIKGEKVLVDFFATWCGPCRMLAPVLDEIAEERSGVSIVKVDIDKCEEIARQFGVMSVPTLILFKNGEMVAKNTGYVPKELLIEFIEKY